MLKRPAFTPLPAETSWLESGASYGGATILRANVDKQATVKRPPSYSFGSRGKTLWNGQPDYSVSTWKKCNPGPAHYKAAEASNKLAKKPSFSITPKPEYSDATPGPGPAAPHYKIQRLAQWQQKNLKEELKESPAFSFSGRSTLGVNWDKATLAEQLKMPGPGDYKVHDKTRPESPHYSLFTRYEDPLTQNLDPKTRYAS